MAVTLSSARLSELQTSGMENNPFVAFENSLAAREIVQNFTNGFPASNLLTGATYDFVQLAYNNAGRAVLGFRPPSPRGYRVIAIAAHNLHEIPGTVSVELLRSGGPSNISRTSLIFTERGEPIVFRDTGSDQHSVFEFRITVSRAGRRTPPRIGVLFAGDEILMPQRLYQGYNPPITPNQLDLQSNVSEGSQLLGSRVIRQGSSATAKIDHLEQAFVRSFAWRQFQRHFNQGRGFFWGWRPQLHRNDVHYAWRSGAELGPQNTGPAGLTSISMAMRFHESEDR